MLLGRGGRQLPVDEVLRWGGLGHLSRTALTEGTPRAPGLGTHLGSSAPARPDQFPRRNPTTQMDLRHHRATEQRPDANYMASWFPKDPPHKGPTERLLRPTTQDGTAHHVWPFHGFLWAGTHMGHN